MINEIQPKIKFQNIVQCPFNYCMITPRKVWIIGSVAYHDTSLLWFNSNLGVWELLYKSSCITCSYTLNTVLLCEMG